MNIENSNWIQFDIMNLAYEENFYNRHFQKKYNQKTREFIY